MSDTLTTAIDRLRFTLAQYDSLAVAVSGGVDSMTLAAITYEVLGDKALMVHAMSPAVPEAATQRVRDAAHTLGWNAQYVDAGEFEDEQYRTNPVNRCYYCKSNLYGRIQHVWSGPIASGANLDDLGDYRPGLLAASERRVVHPLIEAKIDKATVRAIARTLGLNSVSELPAQPCLSSRIETGIAIDANDLAFVNSMEEFLSGQLGPGDVRCRITSGGVRIEVPETLKNANTDIWGAVCKQATQMIHDDKRMLAGFSSYQRGSAFLTDPIVVSKS